MARQAESAQARLDGYIRDFAEAVYEHIPDAQTVRFHVESRRLRDGEWVRIDRAVMDFVTLVRTNKVPSNRKYQQIATFILADHRACLYDQMKRLPRGSVFAKVQFALRDIVLGDTPTPLARGGERQFEEARARSEGGQGAS
jgi:hypothetical protein